MTAPWTLAVAEVDEPAPGLTDVVIEILATGICGSDFHGFTGETGRRQPGQIMGHETVGRVASLGEQVTGLSVGDLVTVNPVLSCDACEVCASGNEQSCPNRTVIGVTPHIQSAFADYLTVRASNVVSLAAGRSPELGALVEPLAVGYHGARRGGCSDLDRVLVIGGGPIGQAAYLGAVRCGATDIVVSDINPARRELCAGLGARVVDPSAGELAGTVPDALGAPASLVIDTVGITPTLADAMTCSTLGSRIVLVGMGAPRVELGAFAISTEERSLIGSFCYSRVDFAETAAWVGTTDLPLDGLIDGRVGYDGAQASFTALANGTSRASKILVFPHGAPGPRDDGLGGDG